LIERLEELLTERLEEFLAERLDELLPELFIEAFRLLDFLLCDEIARGDDWPSLRILFEWLLLLNFGLEAGILNAGLGAVILTLFCELADLRFEGLQNCFGVCTDICIDIS
jgi:hypothetical protein